MKEDSVWGYIAFVAMIIAAYVYFRITWWLNWRRSTGTLPMYGQAWASPHGRRLYVIGVEKNSGDLEPAVSFTDVNPSVYGPERRRVYRWSMAEWRRSVRENQLVLVDKYWFQESS